MSYAYIICINILVFQIKTLSNRVHIEYTFCYNAKLSIERRRESGRERESITVAVFARI